MSNESGPVPAVEARTEKVMIVALLAIAALAIYGLFAATERGAALARMTGGDAPPQAAGTSVVQPDAAR